MTKAEIAQKYHDENRNMPTLELARIMAQKEPFFFESTEAARHVLRYIRGSSGKANRKRRGIEKPHEIELPPSSERVWMPFNLEPTSKDRIALFSDIHVPFHNMVALRAAISEAKRIGSTIILLNGDTMDCHELSKYEKDPRERKFREEIPLVRQFLAYMRQEFPKARIIWKDGNHDERLYLYLRRHAPAVLGVDDFEAPRILRFKEYDIEYVTDKRPIVCGKLNILHGHEYPGGITAPVNPARGLFLRAKACAIQGHQHQTSEHAEPTLEGKSIACWSVGCLSELHPQYMPLNKWNHGFASIEMAKDGNFKIRNNKIINGEIY